MKKSNLFLVTLMLICIDSLFSQEQWESVPANPNVPANAPYDIEMVDGKIHQYFNYFTGTQYITEANVFNKQTQTWDFLEFKVTTDAVTKIITQKIGSTVYLVAYDGIKFSFDKYPSGSNSVSIIQNEFISNVNDNWEFETGTNDEEMYILYTVGTGPSDIYGMERNPGFTWNTMTENSSQNLSVADLQIQVSNDKVYFGVYSNKIRLTYFNKGDIATMFAYDGALGEVLSDGVNWDNSGFVITGNKNDYQGFYGTEDLNNLSYEFPISVGTQIDVNTSSDPTTGFNLDANYLAKESSPSHGFIASLFSTDGVGNPNNKFRVIRRDFMQAGSQWQNVANSVVVPTGTAMNPNSFKLSIDNDFHHIAVSYTIQGQSANNIKVSNKVPYLLNGTATPNAGLCANQLNEIYPSVELMDDDYDKIRIISATSLNSATLAINIVPVGFENGVSKFKILGVPSASTDQIVIQYTDGFNTFSTTLDAYSGNTAPTNVEFVSDPVLFCENEVQVDLAQYVNYYDQGTFRINGQDLISSQINAYELNSILPAGTLRFIQNVNGCIIITTANYQVVAAPSINISVTPTSCSQSTGSATAAVINGASTNLTQYWSTGQTSSTISNLESGAYYYFVIDGNNCKANALASILANDITLDATITNASCYGVADGGVQVTVNGSTDYVAVWSNGQFGDNLVNVSPNIYELTVYDSSGCEVKGSYVISQPTPIDISLSTTNPDCGVSNGKIFTNIAGGAAPYQASWSNGSNNLNLIGLDPGFFALTVTDSWGCIAKDSLFLSNINPVLIQDSIFPSDCGRANGGVTLNIIETGFSGPVNSVMWDNGSTTDDIYDLASGHYMLTVDYGAGCMIQKSFEVGLKPPVRNDICVVTVDEATTTNVIVWEKLATEGISHYNIYREDATAGDYKIIDTVNFSNLSIFNDVIASPLDRSWRYRISAVNTCGSESTLSIPHKTLHLNTIEQVVPGTFDIYWDSYEGLSEGNYIVNRFTDQNGWEALSPTIPFGSPTVFTDTPPISSSGVDYYVGFELAEPCTATFRAQDFNVSRSNKDKGIFNPGEGIVDPNTSNIEIINDETIITVYPNPFVDNIQVKILGPNTEIAIYDIHGKFVHQQVCLEGLNTINTSGFENGLFFIQVQLGKEVRTYKLSKIK